MNAMTETAFLMDLRKEEREVYNAVDRFFGFNTMKLEATEGYLEHEIQQRRKAIKDSVYQQLSDLGICLCGGAITSIFTGEKISDLDFYVKDSKNLHNAARFLEHWFREPPFVSLNASNFKRKHQQRVYNVQLIHRFTGEPQDIFEWFDFTVCMCAYDFQKKSFAFDPRFLGDIASKRLVYGGKSMYPICAMYRTLKYQKKGFKLPGSTVMHIALSVVRLKIDTYRDLKEQLMGIDTSYLQGFLNGPEYKDELPVDYGKFLEDAFRSIDGFSHMDNIEELE